MNSTAAAPALSMTVRTAVESAPTHRNFLFIMPERATQEDHALMYTIAHSMVGMGYVYIASADKMTMEDKGQVRYLPFRAEQFPCFGKVDSVFVLRSREVAKAALSEYQGAEAFLLEPRLEIQELTAQDQRPAQLREAHEIGAFLTLPRHAALAA